MTDKTNEEFDARSDLETAQLTGQAAVRMDNEQRRRVADVLGRDADEIAADLDEIDACVRLYELNRGENRGMPKGAQRAAELRAFQASLAGVLCRSQTVERVLDGTAEYADLLSAARRVGLIIDEVVRLGDAEPRRGRAPDDRQWLIERLIEKYEQLTESQATVSTSAIDNQISGRFFDFVRLVIPDSIFADGTLGKVVKTGLKTYRSRLGAK
ncbi:hypothetical protein F3J20_16095 [Paraburkholderia sp. Cy-641]|uniref:hypothetical protein n=1 Tax=Paraburkholderia sp. Cy-641 TaxID=2608337 RepID=UPI00142448C5|nr:hypothetical protein [Paraburkholderia sp. Cy-641]NIF78889.1 hypothetical protein [Paraburkholderia sp. Cy-641]